MPSRSVPSVMNAITAQPPGGPDVLCITQHAVPSPRPGEVLIKVHSAGVNGADLREREGKYPVPPGAPDIMGLEVSGEIISTGSGCTRFAAGDRVCALLIGGGYAEYALAPEGQCMPVPDGVSLTDAAGLQGAPVHHVGPDGAIDLRQAGGVGERHPVRDRHALPFRCQRVFRIAAADQERADPVAGGKSGAAAAGGDDLSRYFQSHDVGRPWRDWVFALALAKVGPVHTCRMHLDQHLAGAR